MALSPIITLTTDFGTTDYFVGVLKGVLIQNAPCSRIVDITHDISPHDIHSAAFVVQETVNYFPEGTVHLVVVDPGVGTARRKIILKYRKQFFVAPDNGVLTYLLVRQGSQVYGIKDTHENISPTFAARDHFAPVAAALSKGGSPDDLGHKISDPRQIEVLQEVQLGNPIRGRIVYFDRFGNAITNIRKTDVEEKLKAGQAFEAQLKETYQMEIKRNYQEGHEDKPNFIFNSSGWLEIFLPNTSAKLKFKLNLMDSISIHLN